MGGLVTGQKENPNLGGLEECLEKAKRNTVGGGHRLAKEKCYFGGKKLVLAHGTTLSMSMILKNRPASQRSVLQHEHPLEPQSSG